MVLAAFDMETESLPVDGDYNIGITCAALVVLDEETHVQSNAIWWAGMEVTDPPLPPGVDELVALVEQGKVPIRAKMTEEEVGMMFNQLVSALEVSECKLLFTHNGAGFDWPVIAANIPERKEEVIEFCLRTYDVCFQAVRTYGFPIGLDAISQVMLGEGKLMDGGKAAEMWPFEGVEKVLRYVHDDCLKNIAVVQAIMAEKHIRWITKKGKESDKLIDPPNNVDPRWDNIGKLISRTYGKTKGGRMRREPSRKWMDDPKAFSLDNSVGWMPWQDHVTEK